MSAVFVSTTLQNLYSSNGTTNSFRTNGSAEDDNDVKSLDLRIASFEKVIIDALSKPGDYPYDRAGLKREFMDEVLALLLQRRSGGTYYNNLTITYRRDSDGALGSVYIGNPFNGNNQDATLRDGNLTVPTVAGWTPQGGYTNGGEAIANPKNFDDLSIDQKKSLLSDDGKAVYDHYSNLIDQVFLEGDKLKANPNDPGTNAAINSNVVTSIPEVVHGGVTYDKVTTINGQTYLIKKGSTTYEVKKTVVTNAAGQPADFVLGFDPNSTTAPGSADYLAVDANMVPVGAVQTLARRNLSPMWFLYYWNEARIKVLRGQLAFKEAVTSEIRDDLAKAQAVYADLERLAGTTLSVSSDGKTQNPNTTTESLLMDLWEARVSPAGDQLIDGTGNDDAHNYADWATNRSKIKTYIDLKSTQSQDAMLDYQTTLNRFNNAYEIMSKLQEKMDGLVKSQLRNVA